jgi:hypothetical protein
MSLAGTCLLRLAHTFDGQVLVEEAGEFVLALWRQVTFESMAYGEGLDTGKTLVE